ncbi:MAG: carbohydrate ABC transporter permease [Oscillospiraceae bacterium]|jgi:putative aldouronate transport system permease protein|nr:carbohydrate ABC transporter permease [Oscillospiraceae bacterium]
MKLNKSKTGDIIIVVVFIFLICICLFPMMNVFARSMSAPHFLIRSEVSLFPRGFNMDAFDVVWSDSKYTWSLAWTAILTVVCTLISLTLTILCAFPFVYKGLKGRKTLNVFMIFTMYFGAGMVPTFLLMRSLGLIDNPWVLILPSSLSIFNVILMRSFFYGIPDSIRESAEIDGAGPFKTLMMIYLPLSKPVLATISLFYAVNRWNGYADALLFLRTERKWDPIQLLLYRVQQNLTAIDVTQFETAAGNAPTEAIRMATIVIATVPILLVYPFLQKYFVAGVTLGSVKE